MLQIMVTLWIGITVSGHDLSAVTLCQTDLSMSILTVTVVLAMSMVKAFNEIGLIWSLHPTNFHNFCFLRCTDSVYVISYCII